MFISCKQNYNMHRKKKAKVSSPKLTEHKTQKQYLLIKNQNPINNLLHTLMAFSAHNYELQAIYKTKVGAQQIKNVSARRIMKIFLSEYAHKTAT